VESKKVDNKKIEGLVETYCQNFAGKDNHSLKNIWHNLDSITKKKNKIHFLLEHTDDDKIVKFLNGDPTDRELDDFTMGVIEKLKSM
jgi:hypothetical protein